MDSRRRNERASILVGGIVQGVGYRWFILQETRWLGLVGLVENQPDGKVRILAEGRRDSLVRLISLAAIGPPAAKVDSVDVDWNARIGEFSEFQLVR